MIKFNCRIALFYTYLFQNEQNIIDLIYLSSDENKSIDLISDTNKEICVEKKIKHQRKYLIKVLENLTISIWKSVKAKE